MLQTSEILSGITHASAGHHHIYRFKSVLFAPKSALLQKLRQRRDNTLSPVNNPTGQASHGLLYNRLQLNFRHVPDRI
jgi:hypothetical protein